MAMTGLLSAGAIVLAVTYLVQRVRRGRRARRRWMAWMDVLRDHAQAERAAQAREHAAIRAGRHPVCER